MLIAQHDGQLVLAAGQRHRFLPAAAGCCRAGDQGVGVVGYHGIVHITRHGFAARIHGGDGEGHGAGEGALGEGDGDVFRSCGCPRVGAHRHVDGHELLTVGEVEFLGGGTRGGVYAVEGRRLVGIDGGPVERAVLHVEHGALQHLGGMHAGGAYLSGGAGGLVDAVEHTVETDGEGLALCVHGQCHIGALGVADFLGGGHAVVDGGEIHGRAAGVAVEGIHLAGGGVVGRGVGDGGEVIVGILSGGFGLFPRLGVEL